MEMVAAPNGESHLVIRRESEAEANVETLRELDEPVEVIITDDPSATAREILGRFEISC